MFGAVAVAAAAGVAFLFRVAGLDFDGLFAPTIPRRSDSASVDADYMVKEKGSSASWTAAGAAARNAAAGTEAGANEAAEPRPNRPRASR